MTSTSTAADVRMACRTGKLTGPTPGLARGFVQANLVILPAEWAYDFLLFCQRNPKPCPLLAVTDTGSIEAKAIAPGSDVRTDLPGYRVFFHGDCIDEPVDVKDYWRDDLVTFLIGCSFTFEHALLEAGLPVRHIEMNRNVPMYRTNIACKPAGRFLGPMVVSMRPMLPEQAIRATAICSRYPLAHGAPVHFGDPATLGIADLNRPDYGDAVEFRPGEVPVFWACGVTPQAALLQAKPPFAIAHKPGHMFLTDLRDGELRE